MAVPVAADGDLINFDIIENHKENIQSLPSGRSAKQLASILSPLPSGKAKGTNAVPTLEETKTLNDAIRQEYEIEIQSISDSDDPLDIYDRYVKWTLNAYPSAQATPQSQLLPLLERATKAFLTSSHYKNDPRYLKLWLHYIRLFSDSPRETFAFLARHGIGESLGLFYEEFAAWLESADRWVQADEVYKLGIEREARPAERLMRKYAQFQQRFDARPRVENEPSSPALPTVRPALAAKIDPFAPAHRNDDPQPARQRNAGGHDAAPISRSGKPKMAIFSDADSVAPAPTQASNTTKGWDSIGSMKERKKENTVEARPWAGEKLKAGGRVGTVPKMEIFKDPTLRQSNELPANRRSSPSHGSTQRSEVVNPRTGRIERVFVDIDAVYPPRSEQEFSFEELRALSRGWAQRNWKLSPPPVLNPLTETTGNVAGSTPRKPKSRAAKSQEPEDIENLNHSLQERVSLNGDENPSLSIHDVSTQSMAGKPESDSLSLSLPPNQKQKEKRTKIREVKQETQTVKTRLESPSGKKLKRKNSSATEPTMTFHSKAATNEIYDMFNQPLRRPASMARDDTQSGDDTEFTEGEIDDGYSTTGDAESTGTGLLSRPDSEFGDDTLASVRQDNTESQSQSQPDSVSPWSDFTANKHLPRLALSFSSSVKNRASPVKAQGKSRLKRRHRDVISEDSTENMGSSSHNPTQTSGMEGFDTEALAAIANGNFDDMDTKAIAIMAGDVDIDVDVDVDGEDEVQDEQDAAVRAKAGREDGQVGNDNMNDATAHDLATPVNDIFTEHREIPNKPCFVPLPPEDYEPTPNRPYRDPAMIAQHKLPFMTPIVERTESSFAPSTVFDKTDYFTFKTPSRAAKRGYESPSKSQVDRLLTSSSQQQEDTPPSSGKRRFGQTGATEEEVLTSSPQSKEAVGSEPPAKSDSQPLFPITKSGPSQPKSDNAVGKTPAVPNKSPARRVLQPTTIRKGPIVTDLQCNPCDEAIRQQILTAIHPPLSSYSGYHSQSEHAYNHYQTLKSYAEKMAKVKGKGSPRKTQSEKTLTKSVLPILKFRGTTRVYTVKRELGEGAFAPVYLVDSYDPNSDEEDKENTAPRASSNDPGREQLEALKAERPPGTLVWEFHILRLIRQRLGPASRTMQSIILAHECHLYRDEAYIVLSYSPQGTLLDLVNLARSESVKAGKLPEGLDETLAMWFGVELLRTLEDLHRVGILHGDLKGDNCLVRFDPAIELSSPFDSEGNHGWGGRGLKLIDFGRGIDVRMFKPNTQFIADWPSSAQDCAEIRECRPWKWQIDYHGAAGVIHSLLFGKYIETIPAASSGLRPGQKKEWKLKDNLKRYWEKELWEEVFMVLLNPGCVSDHEDMPIQANLRRVRMKMEKWLTEDGERGGRDLRGALRKMERLVCGKVRD
ncbi:uncharacterized protein Z518_04475 [Rhinocladiella mackenziei CBS 650.93]|uniref:Checkpoint serine/threonine-protein kinase n=1 Tax=Rhinocladiella mackenziei CBS 650.93 TaxID=1442369 RepID=A0A0D2ILD5_9EURO|nr:uncharacterized protein Z518_04475 [Rhinocladiella mackenziei CBS 650.93]KIX06499.1 hypothetical protein Z518_04475 [Rhinocladiella mackenziei CBS 650.93]